jgi:multiple sugar transport system substrate-binding protein
MIFLLHLEIICVRIKKSNFGGWFMKRLCKCLVIMIAMITTVGVLTSCGRERKTTDQAIPGKKTNLVFMHMWMQESIQSILNKDKEIFERNFPDYTMEIRYVPFDDINKQLSIGAASGDVPDITFLNNPDFAAYVSMGCFTDITDLVKNWDQFPQFYPDPLEAGTINGKIYGLPFDTNCLALFYNKNMLEAADVKVPATLDELKDAAAKLTDKSKNVYGMIISAHSGEEGAYQFMPFLSAFGGRYDDMTSAAAKQAVQFYVDLVKVGSMTSEIVSLKQGDIRDRFVAQQAAMMTNGTWEVGGLRDKKLYPDLGFEWEVTTIPAGPKGSYSCLGGKIVGIGATRKGNEQVAFEFIKIVCSKDNMLEFITNVGAVPNRVDIAAAPIWQQDPQMAVFVKQMVTAVPRGPHPKWPEISLAIRSALGEAISGTKTVEKALADAQVTIDSVK